MKDLQFWNFPLSLIAAAVFISCIILFRKFLHGSRLHSVLTGGKMSVCLLIAAAALCAVEGTWRLILFRHWAFLAFTAFLMFCLGLDVIEDIAGKRPLSRTLSHCGLFLILFGGFFGAPDFSDVQMAVSREQAGHIAFSADGTPTALPFDVRLADFIVDYYEDGVSPKQFTSVLDIGGRQVTTSVNHPCRHKGYRIYQAGYDQLGNSYSIIKFVRDPWIPLVYAGMALLALASLIGLGRTWKSKAVLPAILSLAAVFCVVSLLKINFSTLMPALRSLWFIPHIIIYMIAYSVLAIALVLSGISLTGKAGCAVVADRLLRTASSLLITGMICGAVWAKAAWGDYWTWDGKECWAAATWLLTLAGTHFPRRTPKATFIFILLAFLAMQLTWYGVNYLPSAQFSLHSYTQG